MIISKLHMAYKGSLVAFSQFVICRVTDLLNFVIQIFSFSGFHYPVTTRGPLLHAYLAESLPKTLTIPTRNGKISFVCLGIMPLYRAKTLLTKEPETITWIDDFADDDVLWDVGANIGVYSLYAASAGKRVFSFEPGAANYYALNRNIEVNQLDDLITAYCVAFSDKTEVNLLFMGDCTLGGALNSFGISQKEDGRSFQPHYRQGMVGFSIDDFIKFSGIPAPNHIKIDVDSIEDRILRGARETIKSPRLKSVLVELHLERADYADVLKMLEDIGLRLKFRKRSGRYEDDDGCPPIFNHLFEKAC